MPESAVVKLKALTPIHIGSGHELSRLDYFLDSGRFSVVDTESLFRDPDFSAVRDAFLQSAAGGEPIAKLVPVPLLKKHTSYRIGVSPSARTEMERSPTQVKTFTKSAGRVYIPGSSVKGAILSALCWRVLHEGWFQEDENRRKTARINIEQLMLQDNGSDSLLATVLPRLGGRATDELGRFTHWLDVSDSDLKAPEEVLGMSLVDVKNVSGGTGSGRPGRNLKLLCETVQAGKEFSFSLKLDPDSKLTVDDALKSVADFYSRVAAKDGAPGDATPKLPETGLIRLGQGSGAYATSLLVFAGDAELHTGRDGYRVKPPRSRKRAGQGNIAMGWAQMTLAQP